MDGQQLVALLAALEAAVRQQCYWEQATGWEDDDLYQEAVTKANDMAEHVARLKAQIIVLVLKPEPIL